MTNKQFVEAAYVALTKDRNSKSTQPTVLGLYSSGRSSAVADLNSYVLRSKFLALCSNW